MTRSKLNDVVWHGAETSRRRGLCMNFLQQGILHPASCTHPGHVYHRATARVKQAIEPANCGRHSSGVNQPDVHVYVHSMEERSHADTGRACKPLQTDKQTKGSNNFKTCFVNCKQTEQLLVDAVCVCRIILRVPNTFFGAIEGRLWYFFDLEVLISLFFCHLRVHNY